MQQAAGLIFDGGGAADHAALLVVCLENFRRPRAETVTVIERLIGVASNESARAQSVYGAISGLITDSSSAIVANAKVTLVNEGTGIQRSVLSNNTGEYVFSQVIPGAYSIGVDAPGFKKVDRKNVILETQAQLKIDLQLEVGAASEGVEVIGEVALIETATAS